MIVEARRQYSRACPRVPLFSFFVWMWLICFGLTSLCRASLAEPAADASQSPAAATAIFDATQLHAPTDIGPVWLVRAGDDPAYARPDLDDSQWTPFNIGKSLKTVLPNAKPEVVWYRIHIKVAPDEKDLALSERAISSAFEIYANGRLLLKAGQVAPFKAYTNSAREVVSIPDADLRTGSLVIAVRVYISRTAWSNPNPGLTVRELTLGQQHEQWEHLWIRAIGNNALYWVNCLLVFGLGLVAIALYTAQRSQREYLWIFLQAVATAASIPWTLITLFHELPTQWGFLQLVFNVSSFIFQAMMYLAFLRQRFSIWMRIYFAITSSIVMVSIAGVSLGMLPTYLLGISIVPFSLFLNAAVPVLLIVHWRRGNREAGILLIPALLNGFSFYAGIGLFFFGLIPALVTSVDAVYTFLFGYTAGPFTLSLEDIGNLLFNLSLLLILVLRSNRMSRRQAVFEGELEAAREVQAVIVPEQLDLVPGFTIESVYEPAQQVGGDFFQVLPTGGGGLLLVVGDVAGKGLPAAMLVSMLVGAIRTIADDTYAPEVMLHKLNERLVGRSRGGFSTALAAHITADGVVTIANAGHLSPYLDGEEIELPGALPLGIAPNVSYEVMQFELPSGSRLTFYSDGVIEAQNQKNELFGFERGQAISKQSAASIVEAAKQFGQSDDITVVAITRAESTEAAMAA